MIFCTRIQMPKSSYHYCKINALPHLWILFTSMYIIFSKTTSTENIIKYDTNSRTCIRLRKLHIHRSSYCHALQAYSAITFWNILLFSSRYLLAICMMFKINSFCGRFIGIIQQLRHVYTWWKEISTSVHVCDLNQVTVSAYVETIYTFIVMYLYV